MAAFISIDTEKCTGCGLCAQDCISGVLRMEEGGKAFVAEPGWCNLCSHCVAICPAGAVTNEGLEGEPARRAVRDRLDEECYREVVMTRRSVRRYKDEPVPRELIEDIIDLAKYSPTASNTMDVGYTVITDREEIRKLGMGLFRQAEKIKKFLDGPVGKFILLFFKGNQTVQGILRYAERFDFFKERSENGPNPVTHDAPVLLVIHGPKQGRFVRENCAIAAANITNYAHAKGLGTCYLGLVVRPADDSKKLRKKLGVPEGRMPYMVLSMGKPAYKFGNTPVRPAPEVDWK